MRILVLHGPNLNALGQREPQVYGHQTLEELNALLGAEAKRLGVALETFQSNSEGGLIDFIYQQAPNVQGIIVNPAGLTHYSIALRDALAAVGLPVIEVHLSNIYSREEWRRHSVIAPIAIGQIAGFGWRSYAAALRLMVEQLTKTER